MMLYKGVFFLLGLSLQPPAMVLGQGDEGCECGGAGSSVAWDDMAAALKYYARCSYPTNKLNLDCILSSCHMLKSVCPLSSNGCVDEAALSSAVCKLNACIGQNGLICGINMSRTPVSVFTWSLTQLVPPEVANGTVSIIPGTGFIHNLSNARFSLPPRGVNTNGSMITLVIAAPDIVHAGNNSCSLRIAPASFVNAFKGLLPTLTVPDMAGVIRLNLTSTVCVDLSTSPSPSIKTLDVQSTMASEFTNFISDIGAKVPSIVVKPFNDALNRFLRDSVISSTTTDFLSTYAALGLKAAQLNCPLK